MQKTALYDWHCATGGHMVPFFGWEMPLHYGSQLEEHHQVRKSAGLFDVSHMNRVELHGTKIAEFLRFLLANNVDKLKSPGHALYSCLLNEQGGTIDDLIVYRLPDERWWLVLNAATHAKDMSWLHQQSHAFEVTIEERLDLGMIALQGPLSLSILDKVLPGAGTTAAQLKAFHGFFMEDYWIARTGYTGEDGVEIIAPAQKLVKLWAQLHAAGVKPCGLAARDTLRLEAGLNLYGQDMDETHSPLVANLAWTVAWQPASRDFIGRKALEQQKDHLDEKLVGLIMTAPGVLRNGQIVLQADGSQEVGVITSGGFSPTLNHAIALARVQMTAFAESNTPMLAIERRGQIIPVQVVCPPFVRHGQSQIQQGLHACKNNTTHSKQEAVK